MNKVKVFRSGVVEAPAERGCEREVFAAVDALRPEGHPTRTHGIFAAPTIEGVVRWVRGNAFASYVDIKVRQITVDADMVRVYNVTAWEHASMDSDMRPHQFAAAAQRYFDTSMTLTEWLAGDYDPRDWEVIIPADDVISVAPVSAKRVVDATKDDYEACEVKKMLR